VVDDLANLRLNPTSAPMAVFEPRRFTLARATSHATGLGLVEELRSSLWISTYRESQTYRHPDWQRTLFDDDVLAVAGMVTEAKLRPVGNHTITVEADVRIEGTRAKRWEVRDDQTIWWQRGRYPDGTRSRSTSVALSDHWALDNGLVATASARWSGRNTVSDYGPTQFGLTGIVRHVNRRYGALSWKASVAKEWDEGWRLSASLTSASRAPGLDEQVANAYWLYGRDVPNPDLVPERATQADVTGRFERARISAGVSLYRTRYSNLIRRNWFEPGPDGASGTVDDLYRFCNMRSAVVTGADMDVDARPGHVLGLGVELSGRLVLHGWESNEAAVPHYSPSVVGRIGSRLSRGTYWMEPFVRFSSAAPAVTYSVAGALTDDTPGWLTLNVRGGFRLADGLVLGFSVENLRDTRYVEHGSYIIAPGRNLVLSGSYRF
jgi:outer membrane receptor protein involved in Fe transport